MIFTGKEAHLVASDWFEDRGQALVAKALRSAPWAQTVGEDQYGVYADLRVGETKQRFRWIRPGSFIMGSPDDEKGRWDDEGPQHKVTFTKGFWMADTPCTQLLWSQVMGSNPSLFKNNPNNPVERVSWDDIQGFYARLGRFAPELNARLPSEEEWEYACRAGTALPRYGELDDIAWYAGNSGGTHPVGLKEPNPWGLYDMLGNVDEWCADGWGDTVSRPTTSINPRPRGLGRGRSRRGGSYDAFNVRAAYRYWYKPEGRFETLGFRFIIE